MLIYRADVGGFPCRDALSVVASADNAGSAQTEAPPLGTAHWGARHSSPNAHGYCARYRLSSLQWVPEANKSTADNETVI